MEHDEDILDEVARAHRALAAAGQSDLVWGHAALRDPDVSGSPGPATSSAPRRSVRRSPRPSATPTAASSPGTGWSP